MTEPTRTTGRPAQYPPRRDTAPQGAPTYREDPAYRRVPAPRYQGISGQPAWETPPTQGVSAARVAPAAVPASATAPAPAPAVRASSTRSSVAPAPAQPAAGRRRIDALDGLRTLAILSIVAYHLGLSWLPSGHMGVVVFLVLTGYLITGSVLRSWDRTGKAGLPALWWKRLKRIWPAMALMVVAVAATCVCIDHILLTKMRPDILPSLGMFLNWRYIVAGLSYFDQIGSPSPLTHLWYIGLDAQVCVLVPLVLALVLKLGGRGRVGRVVCLALALVSAVLMAVLYVPGADPSRVYYGTDTRVFAVFLGAWLAFVWPLGSMPESFSYLFQTPPAGTRGACADEVPTPLANVMGAVSLAGIVAIMAFVPSDSPFFYYGGMLLVALLCVVLMASLMTPGTWMARFFGLRPLAWFGERSYGVYLWHYPVIDLMGAWKYGAAWWVQLLAVVVSVALALASWVLVEKPIASGRLEATLGALVGKIRGTGGTGGAGRTGRAGRTDRTGAAGSAGQTAGSGAADAADGAPAARIRRQDDEAVCIPKVAAYGGVLLVLVGTAAIGCAVVPEETLVPAEAIVSTGAAADKGMDLTEMRAALIASSGTDAGSAQDGTGTGDGQEPPSGDALVGGGAGGGEDGSPYYDEALEYCIAHPGVFHSSPEVLVQGIFEPMLIGDSVAAGGPFYEFFPEGLTDCYVGRNLVQAIEVFREYLAEGIVGRIVVFSVFSNTTPWPYQLEELVELAGPYRQIYLIGTVNPDGFQEQANWNLLECANAYDNVHYVDWPAVVAGNEDVYLWGDMTHPRDEGEWAYQYMIACAIARDFVEGGSGWISPLY